MSGAPSNAHLPASDDSHTFTSQPNTSKQHSCPLAPVYQAGQGLFLPSRSASLPSRTIICVATVNHSQQLHATWTPFPSVPALHQRPHAALPGNGLRHVHACLGSPHPHCGLFRQPAAWPPAYQTRPPAPPMQQGSAPQPQQPWQYKLPSGPARTRNHDQPRSLTGHAHQDVGGTASSTVPPPTLTCDHSHSRVAQVS